MEQPSGPRFTTSNRAIQLAPWSPDPEADYHWEVERAPPESDVDLPDEPVVEFVPEQPGRYVLSVCADEQRHEVTVRVFPDVSVETTVTIPYDNFDSAKVAEADPEELSVVGGPNDYVLGQDRPEKGEDELRFRTSLPPGMYPIGMGLDADFDETVEYVYWQADGPNRPSVQLDGHVDGDAAVLTPSVHLPGGDEDTEDEIEIEYYVDDRDTADLATEGDEAIVSLDSFADSVRVHAVAVGDRPSVADTVVVRDEGVENVNEPPDWASDAVVYEIFVRSFCDSLSDLRGRLDYLEHLGVDCVYLTPVFEKDSEEHGYHVTDLFSVADDLGSLSDFEAVVEACHRRGMRVVLDLVLNHTSKEHEFFQSARDPDSEYREWYRWEGDDAASQFGWDIASLDFSTLAVRQHLLEAADFWADVVDGFRCDLARVIPHSFWKEFRHRIKSKHPEFLLIDESMPYRPEFGEAEFDVHYDDRCYHKFRQIGKGEPAASLYSIVRARETTGFRRTGNFVQYVESHDFDRYRDEVGPDAQRAAVAAQFTLPGVPLVYAGQELGLEDRREEIRWGEIDTRSELVEYHRSLIALRKRLPELRHGSFEPVNWHCRSPTVVAFGRRLGDERVVVVLNFGEETETVSVSERVDRDVQTGESVTEPFEVESYRVLR